MDQLRKTKIKEVMIQHLKEKVNFPNCDFNVILAQLKPMWIKLEEAGLTKGLNFQAYAEQANSQAMMSQLRGMFSF